MRIGTHATMTGRRDRCELLAELAMLIEQFARPVALHPFFELSHMVGFREIRKRNLMRAPGSFDGYAVDKFRPGPAFGRAEDDHRPDRTLQAIRVVVRSGGALD